VYLGGLRCLIFMLCGINCLTASRWRENIKLSKILLFYRIECGVIDYLLKYINFSLQNSRGGFDLRRA